MGQITDSTTPNIKDVKRQLNNCRHELSEILREPGQQQVVTGMIEQALYRVREALTHLDSAEQEG